jgi:hypothetical protein
MKPSEGGGGGEVVELCKCRPTLVYGGKILLNSATLRLIRCDCACHGVGLLHEAEGGEPKSSATILQSVST